jgi:hypothetical protein
MHKKKYLYRKNVFFKKKLLFIAHSRKYKTIFVKQICTCSPPSSSSSSSSSSSRARTQTHPHWRRPQIKMPQASRGSGLEDVEPTPGPGAYDTGGTLESVDHGVSFKGTAAERDGVRGDRLRGREAEQIPGSGSYDVGGGGDASRVSTARGGRVSVKSAAMGYEMQRPADATESYLMSVPGPGEYDTQGITRLGREEAAHVPVIGTEPRNTSGVARDSWALPGPGSHDTVGRHHEWFVGGGGGGGGAYKYKHAHARAHTHMHTHTWQGAQDRTRRLWFRT